VLGTGSKDYDMETVGLRASVLEAERQRPSLRVSVRHTADGSGRLAMGPIELSDKRLSRALGSCGSLGTTVLTTGSAPSETLRVWRKNGSQTGAIRQLQRAREVLGCGEKVRGFREFRGDGLRFRR